MTCSMSRKGDCWDNAVVESFFANLKREEVAETVYATRQEARPGLVQLPGGVLQQGTQAFVAGLP